MIKKLLVASLFLSVVYAADSISYNGEIQNIKLSNNSWNRLIFDSDINAEPIYSKEKNIDIYKANKSVFIKFKPMMKVEVFDKSENILEIDYNKSKKSELFISTDTGTYSFTIEPTDVDAKTYFIQNIQTAQKDILKFEINPVRKVLKTITKNIFLNEDLKNYKKYKSQNQTVELGDLQIDTKYIFEGKIYKAYLYEVTALKDLTEPIDQKIFLNIDLKNKRSISIKDELLVKDQTTLLTIIVGK